MSLLFLFMLHSDMRLDKEREEEEKIIDKTQFYVINAVEPEPEPRPNQATHNNDKRRKEKITLRCEEEYDLLASTFMQWNFVQNMITYTPGRGTGPRPCLYASINMTYENFIRKNKWQKKKKKQKNTGFRMKQHLDSPAGPAIWNV